MYSLKLSMDNVTVYTETVYNLIQQIQQEIWTKIGKSRLFAPYDKRKYDFRYQLV